MYVAGVTASRARSDDEAMLGIVEEEGQSHRPVALATKVAVFTFQCTKGSVKNNFAELGLRFAPDLAAND